MMMLIILTLRTMWEGGMDRIGNGFYQQFSRETLIENKTVSKFISYFDSQISEKKIFEYAGSQDLVFDTSQIRHFACVY